MAAARSRAWRGRRRHGCFGTWGYDAPDDAPLLFGKVRRLDERLLRALDIDTRSVGEIFRPRESQFRFLADDLYIDEWGIKRKFTGMYWDIVENPLKTRPAPTWTGISGRMRTVLIPRRLRRMSAAHES